MFEYVTFTAHWHIIQKRGSIAVSSSCDSYRIQTCNLLIRSQMLYSVELRSHLSF